MRIAGIVLVTLGFTTSFLQLKAFQATPDVSSYFLEIKVSHKKKRIAGTSIITFKRPVVKSSLSFHLHPGIEIYKAHYNDRRIPVVNKRNGHWEIPIPRTTNKRYSALRLLFGGKPELGNIMNQREGFLWIQDEQRYPWLGIYGNSNGAINWWPYFSQSDKRADSISVAIICNEQLTGISNGKFYGIQSLAGNFRRYQWKVNQPMDPREVSILIGRYHAQPIKNPLDMSNAANYFFLERNSDGQLLPDNEFIEAFQFLENTLGPYPYSPEKPLWVQTKGPSLARQQLLSIDESVGNKKSNTGIWVMEMAYDWIGGNIKAKSDKDLWINEGLMSFLKNYYLEKVQKVSLDEMLSYSRASLKNTSPINEALDHDLFHKGQWLFQMLRFQAGSDGRWEEILARFIQRYQGSDISTDEFRKFIARNIDNRATTLIRHYTENAHLPKLEYYFEQKGKNTKIFYRWANCSPTFSLPVEIRIAGKTAIIYPESNWEHLEQRGISLNAISFDSSRALIELKQVIPE